MDLLTAFTDYYKTSSTHYKLSLTRHSLYKHITPHSMADINKQINKGQEKWSQGVNITSITDVNNYIKFKVLEYKYFKLINDDLWKQYKEDFTGFTKAIFKACSIIPIYNLQNLLYY